MITPRTNSELWNKLVVSPAPAQLVIHGERDIVEAGYRTLKRCHGETVDMFIRERAWAWDGRYSIKIVDKWLRCVKLKLYNVKYTRILVPVQQSKYASYWNIREAGFRAYNKMDRNARDRHSFQQTLDKVFKAEHQKEVKAQLADFEYSSNKDTTHTNVL